jgi:hypothetical protein
MFGTCGCLLITLTVSSISFQLNLINHYTVYNHALKYVSGRYTSKYVCDIGDVQFRDEKHRT